MLSALSIWLRRLWTDRRANVAIITALCALPILGMAGLSIDYALLLMNKTKLDAAADAAAVAAITTAQTAIQGGSTATVAKAAGEAQGRLAFAANAGSIAFAQSGPPTPNVNVTPSTTQSGTTLSATVTYGTQMATNFGRLVGVPQFNIGGTSASSLSLPTYKNYYVLVDTSNSMGIGATQTDMANLFARVKAYGNGSGGEAGCVFGCHVTTGSQAYTNEYLAHYINPSINLRIDAAADAINTMIQTAKASPNASRIKLAIYTMDEVNADKSNALQLYQAMTPVNSLSMIGKYSIHLGQNTSSGLGDSDFTASLAGPAGLSQSLQASGDGSSANSPINYVFIITDGLIDTYSSSCTFGHCTAAFDPAPCQTQLKNAFVGVIYTTYFPIYNNNDQSQGLEVDYNTLASTPVNSIPTNLKKCASQPTATYYHEATDGPAITTALQQLFAGTDAPARVTQ